MEKQRYLVVIVRPPSEAAPSSPDNPSLLLPFSPQATVGDFVQALWERLIRRHGQLISPRPDSHHVTLHLGDEAGPTLGFEDVLSDVVLDAQLEKLFAVFSENKSKTVPEQTEKVRCVAFPSLMKLTGRVVCLCLTSGDNSESRQGHS